MIDTIEVPSRSRAGTMHKLFIHNGKAAGCTCERRQYNPGKPCGHMIAYESRKRDEERTRYLYYEMGLGIL